MAAGHEPGVSSKPTHPARGRKIRYDAPLDGGPARGSETDDLLDRFRAWEKVNGRERRTSLRYAPAEAQAWAGWWKCGRFLVTPAELINLSPGGALVLLDRRPPTSQPVWVCLGDSRPSEYAQARVLEASTGRADGPYHARLEFHTPCPPSFFSAAGRQADAPGGSGPAAP